MWLLPCESYFNIIHTSSAWHSGVSLLWQRQKGRQCLRLPIYRRNLASWYTRCCFYGGLFDTRWCHFEWSDRLPLTSGNRTGILMSLTGTSVLFFCEKMHGYFVTSSFPSIVSSLSADLHTEEAASLPLHLPFFHSQNNCADIFTVMTAHRRSHCPQRK